MPNSKWAHVLIGPDGPRWATVRTERTVLIVVHTVTAMNRLDDILSVFDSDHRVQLIFTFPGASFIAPDVDGMLQRRGYLTIPWHQATKMPFDLAISAHHSGDLHNLMSPIVLLPHGTGYSKFRDTKTVYGLAPEWLMRDGHVFPAALVLSHKEQCARLSSLTPDALAIATVAGDPCYDRLNVSRPHKNQYRHALGADLDTTVVVVSSTWGAESLFGRHPELVNRLAAELEARDNTICLILHPNVWYAHGPGQIRRWLREALNLGLRLIPPDRGWQQCILAADVVIGDGGSVTAYAAAAGKPTVLASYAAGTIVPGSSIDAVRKLAPRLQMERPIAQQIHNTKNMDVERFSLVSELVTSLPGASASLLRRLFYGLMRLQEPDSPTPVPHLPVTDLSQIWTEDYIGI